MHRIHHRRLRAAARALVLTAALPTSAVLAQQAPDLPQPSPKARVEQRVGVTDFAIDYSSPGVKSRDIWGALVPYDQLWRTGANAATTLTASRDFTFGGKPVKAGTYALYTIPGKTSWTVLLNTNAKASGTTGYEQQNDVARVTVTPATAPERERMTFIFSDTTDDATRLDLEWAKLRVSVPITVDTGAHVRANIDETLAETWRPHFNSARYLLENNGDLNQALGYADTSIAVKPTWWNNWVRAQILAKQGRDTDAVAAAERAQSLGKGDRIFEQFFAEQVGKSIATWKAS
ncbi:MAG: DUF2911 domain-containing protein [Candidatus Binatia bacterium]